MAETTKDYGKPVGWVCLTCGNDHPDNCAAGWCQGIFVYEPIPPGQRPEAEDPDEDTVCTADGDFGENHIVAITADCLRSHGAWIGEPEPYSLASAVLWVAEGRLK